MANKRGPRFKEARRLGLDVYGHPKTMERADGTFNRENKRLSNYGMQLLEKQRLKAYYGLLEKKFNRYVEKAMQEQGITANNLYRMLELRLDNLVYRIGFARSIRQARQMVSHGHILVNKKIIDIPSYEVNIGDEISLKKKQQKNDLFQVNFRERHLSEIEYLSRDEENFSATLVRLPEREEIPVQIDDQLVIEYYAK
ncbi:MAG: 30S ribosomal protein S4 [Bacillota bacterium]